MLKKHSSTIFILLALFNLVKSQSVAISEINYHSDASISSGNWIEVHNYGSSAADITGWKITKPTAVTPFIFPATTTINPGEYLVVVNNPVAFSTVYPSVSNFIGTLPFGAGNNGDTLLLLNASNVLVEQVQYLDTFPWSFGADGGGNTLERIAIPGSPSDPNNWFDGCIGGSPGTAYSTCTYDIVFSEINYNSDTFHDAGNWVEIRNVSDVSKNIGNWVFMDKKDTITHQFVIPAGTTLAAHSNFVLYQDALLFPAQHSEVTASKKAGPFVFNFSNRGELLRLYDNSGMLQFSVRYGDANVGWPAGADGGGYTLELADSTGNLNDADNWFQGCLYGSPAKYYSTPCTTGNETFETLNFALYPNPCTETLLIESDNTTETICVFNSMGEKVSSLKPILNQTLSIDVRDWPSGIYHIQMGNHSSHFSVQH